MCYITFPNRFGTCPGCGRCPACGRGGSPWPQPHPPWWWKPPAYPVNIMSSDNATRVVADALGGL